MGRLSIKKFTVIIILILSADLVSSIKTFDFLNYDKFTSVPETVQFIQNSSGPEPFRTFDFRPGNAFYSRAGVPSDDWQTMIEVNKELIVPNTSSLFGIQSADGYDNIMTQRYSRVLRYLGSGYSNYPGPALPITAGPVDGDYLDQRLAAFRDPAKASMLGMMNVRYVTAEFPLPKPYSEVFKTSIAPYNLPISVYELSFLPRSYFSRSIIPATGNDDALFGLLTKTNFYSKTLVECTNNCPEAGTGDIISTSYKAGNITLRTKSSRGGFLVVSESNVPDWHAFVDGTESKIYTANYIYQGILVPAGEHSIEFKYQ